jgi:hypothetical protein
MISLKSFNLSRLLSQQVAPVCLGRELQGSNVFLDFFGCVSPVNLSDSLAGEATVLQTVNEILHDLFFNDHRCVVIHEIEQLNDIRISHPNAAAARGAANFALVFCAVGINEALARVGIVVVQSV